MKSRVLRFTSNGIAAATVRRDCFLAVLFFYIVGVTILFFMSLDVSGFLETKRKNVLLIIVDDLRPELGCYADADSQYSRDIKTPHIDNLASRSLLLKRAYVQQSLCSPSRTSFLTGRRPVTTHVYDLKSYFREVGGNFTTIPQYFKENGYISLGVGKIFHPGKESGNDDQPWSWSKRNYHPSNLRYWDNITHSFRDVSKQECERKPLPDMQVVEKAVYLLNKLSKSEKPFFMAIGFYKPHLPFVVPKEFVALYRNVSLPTNMYAPQNMPKAAWSHYAELRSYGDISFANGSGKINSTLPDVVVRNLRRHYYAAVSYIDSLVGKVFENLQNLGMDGNTIVAFLGDHGWQLGEHGEWCKHTNFEIATHAPMMVHIPGMTDKGMVTEKLTEFVDLFPTLVDAAGLPPMSTCPAESTNISFCTEGMSLLPLIRNPNLSRWKSRVFSQYRRPGNIMGYSMRTDRYRYTEWVEFSGKPLYKPRWNISFGVELYDHNFDPPENFNRAHDFEYAKTRRVLREQLHLGWQSAVEVSG